MVKPIGYLVNKQIKVFRATERYFLVDVLDTEAGVG